MTVWTEGKKRVVLSGYYGCGNLGDEAVLAGIHDAFRRCAGDSIELTVLSQNPGITREIHGLNAVPRMDMKAVKAAIRRSDLLISGGGSLLQDTTSLRSLLYYLYIMRVAIKSRVPFMLYAQGIGPLNRALSRKLVSMVVQRAACITVRDPGSEQLLRSIGVSRTPIEVTADPAFALEPASQSLAEAVFAAQGLASPDQYIGVSLRLWGDPQSAPLDRYRMLLDLLESRWGKQCLLIPMHQPDDAKFAERVLVGSGLSCPILQGEHAPHLLLGIVSQLQAMVAMRLHSLIFAARTAVIPYALSYDPKVDQLMNLLGLNENLANWSSFDPETVACQIASQITTRGEHIALLQSQALDREQAALRNCHAAMELLTGTKRR